MIGLIISGCIAILGVVIVIVVNINHRVAYFFYKIPKIHQIIKLFIFREKKYLKETELFIPHSIMPIIDDIGWREGGDLRKKGGPSRLITKRDSCFADYKNIVEIGRLVGTRLPSMMIISDFDHQGICALPEYNMPMKDSNLTEQGIHWKNKNSIEDNKRLISYLYKNSQNIEIGLHGIRHEHFFENGFQNAEWADGEKGISWGEENTRLHCEVFEKILRQYFSKMECGFPKSFVPPSHAFAYHSNDAKILNEYGVKYMYCSCKTRPSMKFLQNTGVFSNGVLILDRTELNGVNKQSHTPRSLTHNAWIGTHFPNYWGNSVKKWARFLRNINKNYDTMLGRNSESNNSQWIYNHYTASQMKGTEITLNNMYMPQWVYEHGMAIGVWIKAHLHSKQHINKVEIEGLTLGAYYEDEKDNAYMYLLDNNGPNGILQQKIYQGHYTLGKDRPQCTYIDIGKETFNVKGLFDDGKIICLTLEIYGEHVVRIHTEKIISQATCNTSRLSDFAFFDKQIKFTIKAKNIMGETVKVIIAYR